MRGLIWEVSKEGLEDAVRNSRTFVDVLRIIGYNTYTGRSYEILKNRLDEDGIGYSHFLKHVVTHKRYELSDILVKDSTFMNRGELKKKLIKANLVENKCSDCGQQPMWNNKALVFVLDHINGINDDNRLENLRFLCPNCNSQTTTFCGRNCKEKRKVYYCDCGEVIKRGNKLCRKCYLLKFGLRGEKSNFCECGKKIKKTSAQCKECWCRSKRKELTFTVVNGSRVDKSDLLFLVTQYSLESIGKKFGVSGNALKKHCKKLEIPLGDRRSNNGKWKVLDMFTQGELVR